MGFNPLINVTGRPLVILITIASSCGFLLFGYDNGVFSGLIVSPWFLKTFDHPKAGLLGTISALYNIGGTVGSIIAFFFGSHFGRRYSILSGIFICTIGGIIEAVSTDIGELCSGRIICGVGVGIMTSTVGLWQAETAPARSRGRYLVFQLLGGAATGLFFAQWINYGFHANSDRVAFAFPVAFQLIFLFISGTLVTFLPESPRWLVKKGRIEEAEAILIRLQGADGASERLAEIIKADMLERHVEGNHFAQLFAKGATQNFRRLCLCCGVMIMHQLNGINSITYYLPTLLGKFIGAPHKEVLWIAGLSSIDSIVFAAIPCLLIDRVGRRPFLWGGALFQTIMFAIISALLATRPADKAGGHTFGVVTVVLVYLYYGVNAMTWLGPSWAYPAEILPLQIREKGLALGNICYWLFQFLIVEVTPLAVTNIGYKFYVILTVCNFCSFLIVYLFYPETKGLSLEEIDFFFARKYGDVAEMNEVNEIVDIQMKGHGAEHIEVAGDA